MYSVDSAVFIKPEGKMTLFLQNYLNIEGRVRFLISAFFSRVPSLREGFGLPPIEAMSCGVPCILTDSGSYQSLDSVKDFACFVSPLIPRNRLQKGFLGSKRTLLYGPISCEEASKWRSCTP